MLYRVRATGEYPVTQSDLRLRYRNISFPQTWDQSVLEIVGVDEVAPSPVPETTAQERAVEGAPVLTDAGWVQGWEIVARVPAEDPHVVTGAAFLSLFTPTEVAAMWGSDPRVMAGALKVAAQDSCNMDSAECAALLQIAVANGSLMAERLPQILAGQPPA